MGWDRQIPAEQDRLFRIANIMATCIARTPHYIETQTQLNDTFPYFHGMIITDAIAAAAQGCCLSSIRQLAGNYSSTALRDYATHVDSVCDDKSEKIYVLLRNSSSLVSPDNETIVFSAVMSFKNTPVTIPMMFPRMPRMEEMQDCLRQKLMLAKQQNPRQFTKWGKAVEEQAPFVMVPRPEQAAALEYIKSVGSGRTYTDSLF